MSERNEAREDGYDMWWRAASDIEDNAKDDVNRQDADNSNDDISRAYDESSKDLEHSNQLQLSVDREATVLHQRLERDWNDVKGRLKRLGGN
jgi:hypothetical protein